VILNTLAITGAAIICFAIRKYKTTLKENKAEH